MSGGWRLSVERAKKRIGLEVLLVILAALGVVASSVVTGHYTVAANNHTVDAQSDDNRQALKAQAADNRQTLKAQARSLRRQARQQRAEYLRSARSAAYAELLQRDRDLRAIEYSWRDDLTHHTGDPEADAAQATSSYGQFAEARLQVQLVATCLPREYAKALGAAHFTLRKDFRRGLDLDFDVKEVETASGRFLGSAQRDLKHAGRGKNNGKCSRPR